LVVCPLISLMEDQVAHLNAIGISAGFVGGSSTMIAERQAMDARYTVLYITPEKLMSWRDEVQRLCQRRQLTCIAIDECHCVSEWGFDFRPAYRNISCIRDWFPGVPMIALTATATKVVTADIIRQLRMRNPAVYNAGFNRPNLHYSVLVKESENDVVNFIARYYRPYANNGDGGGRCYGGGDSSVPSALVYTHTRKDAERIATSLEHSASLHGIRSAFYHAGMSHASRSDVQRSFSRDEVNIVVATIAFGMGLCLVYVPSL
jgi:RecQ family ATP-dependent DNA helicase